MSETDEKNAGQEGAGGPGRHPRLRGTVYRLPAAAAVVVLLAAPARAEHAVIDLRLVGPDGEASANSDQEPPTGGVNEPPVLEVKPGDPLVMQFILTNVYPHGDVKKVTVRYYVIRTSKLGRKTTPSLDHGIVTEGEVTMNFKPKCRVGARLKFRAPEPGLYSVRVDTVNTQSDHEHFSAIDLKVK